MKMHVLKINNDYIEAVFTGTKKAELRKNDRDFKIGDLISFINVDGTQISPAQKASVTKPSYYQNLFLITDICEYKDALKEGYVMLSLERCVYFTLEYYDKYLKERN